MSLTYHMERIVVPYNLFCSHCLFGDPLDSVSGCDKRFPPPDKCWGYCTETDQFALVHLLSNVPLTSKEAEELYAEHKREHGISL